MPLQKFRDRQKTIYWLVAIIVVPSFILLGFSGAFMSAPHFVVGSYFGQQCQLPEFERFQRRLYGVNRGQPTYLVRRDLASGQIYPLCSPQVSAFLMMAFINDAARHGVEVSDEEIATFMRTQIGYTGKDQAEFRRLLQQQLNQRVIPLDTLFEYQLAVKEHLLVRKFLALLDNSLIVPRALAELTFMQTETAEFVIRRAFVATSTQMEKATKTINELPEAELLLRAEAFIRERQISQNRQMYPYLWELPRWRLEYITVPLSPLPADLNEEQLEEEKAKRMLAATSIIQRDFAEFLQRKFRASLAVENQETITPLTIAEINADERLQKLNLRAGDSGATLLTAEAIFAAEALKDFAAAARLLQFLDVQIWQAADREKTPEAVQAAITKMLAPYKNNFRGYPASGGGGDDLPISGENGLLNFRIVEYIAGAPRRLQSINAAGQLSIDGALLAAIKKALIDDLANRETLQQANEMQMAMSENKAEGENSKIEKVKYPALVGTLARIRGANLGQVLPPQYTLQPEAGFEVVQLVDVDLTKPEGILDNNKIDREQKLILLQARSGQMYAPELPNQPFVVLGERGYRYLQTNFNDGKIAYDPRLDARE